MPNRYPQQTAPHDWDFDGANVWCDADDDVPDSPFADGVDAAVFTVNSNVVTMDGDGEAASLTMGGGTLIGTGYVLTAGGLLYQAGTVTDLSATLKAGTSDLNWNSSISAIKHLVIPDGAKGSIANRTQVAEITFGGGVGGVSLIGGGAGRDLYCRFDGNGRWHQDRVLSGDVSPDDLRIYAAADIEIGYLDASAVGTEVRVYASTDDRTVTMTDDWTTGAKPLNLTADTNDTAGTLDLNDHNLVAGIVTLGATARLSGIIYARTGDVRATSIVGGHTDNMVNAFHFGTGRVSLSVAEQDFDDVIVTSSGGRVAANSISHCNVIGRLIAWGVKNAGDCSGDVEWTPRSNMMPMAA